MRLVRAMRCLSVSVFTTVLSSVILVGLAVGLGIAAGPANFIAVACGIPPSYLANRRWVWRQPGRGSVAREVIPFWAMSLAALACSTWFVSRVGVATARWGSSSRSVVLPVASATVFGALWLVQFALLDRVIFRAARDINSIPDVRR